MERFKKIQKLKRLLVLLAVLLLIASLASCDKVDAQCFHCTREVFINDELFQDGPVSSNVYCDMDYSSAYHVEQAHSTEYVDEELNRIRIEVSCKVLVQQ